MPCGCAENEINVVGDGVTAEVVNDGNGKFTVSAIIPIRTIEDTTCIDLEVVDGDLTAELLIADPEIAGSSIELECTADGLVGDVRIDPASSADVTLTSDGLRIDAQVIPTVGAVPTGTVIDFEGWRTPIGYIEGHGQEELISSFPELYDWLTLVTETATVNSGSAVISGLPSTYGMYPGMLIQALGWGGAEAIATVDSPTQITLSSPSAVTDAGGAYVRAFKDGVAPSGDSYFIVPDHRDVVTAGVGNMGGTARDYAGSDAATGNVNKRFGAIFGAPDVTLSVAELATHDHVVSVTDPGHDHGVSDPGHAHGGTADSGGGHTHGAGAASDRSYVTTDTLTPTTAAISVAGTDDVIITLGLEATPRQTNNQATSPGGTHGHTLSIDAAATGVDVLAAATGITADAQDAGSNEAHNNVQPTRYVRKLVKT